MISLLTAYNSRRTNRKCALSKKILWPRLAAIAGLLAAMAAAGCSTVPANSDRAEGPALKAAKTGRAKSYRPFMTGRAAGYKAVAAARAGRNYSGIGRASWYGRAFQGKRTASGEIFDMDNLTAAHRTMPLPSYARITNLKNGSSVIVRVNDRGPYAHNRLIDLSQRAAQLLGYHRGGLANVKVDYVGPAPAKTNDKAFLRSSYRQTGAVSASDPVIAGPQAGKAAKQPAAAGQAGSGALPRREEPGAVSGSAAEKHLSALIAGKAAIQAVPAG